MPVLIPMRCVVTPPAPGAQTDDRPDVRVYYPDGAEYLGMRMSASSLETFKLCPRKWGYDKLDKLPRGSSKAADLGKQAHGELEGWLTHGVPPKMRLLTDSGVLQMFPPPSTYGLKVEQPFAFAYDGVVFFGYTDAEVVGTVYDLKTTGGLEWAKTPEELRADTQGCIYALAQHVQYGLTHIDLKWCYTRTKQAPKSLLIHVSVAFDHAIAVLAPMIAQARRMMDLKATPPTSVRLPVVGASGISNCLTGAALDANWRACGAFGGCAYASICSDRPAGSSLGAMQAQGHLRQSRMGMAAQLKSVSTGARDAPHNAQGDLGAEATMGLMDNIRAGLAAGPGADPVKLAKVDAAMEKAQPVAVGGGPVVATPPPPASTPAETASGHVAVSTPPAKASALTGRLSALIAARTGQPPVEHDAVVVEVKEKVVDSQAADETGGRGRGRPPGAKNKPKDAAVAPAAASPASAPPPPASESPTSPRHRAVTALVSNSGFQLLLDAVPVKTGIGVFTPVEDLIAPARALVEQEAKRPYRLVDFGKGPSLLAAQLDENFTANPPVGVYCVLTAVLDREVLEVLIRHAGVVLMGVR